MTIVRCRTYTTPEAKVGISFARNGYMQLDTDLGVKLEGHQWRASAKSVEELVHTKSYTDALNEYKMQKLAHKHGLAPKPIRLGIIKANAHWGNDCNTFRYSPGLWMDHVECLTLREAFDHNILGKNECRRLSHLMFNRLLRVGLYHHDLHGSNIILPLTKKGKIFKNKKMLAIDFESCNKTSPTKRTSSEHNYCTYFY